MKMLAAILLFGTVLAGQTSTTTWLGYPMTNGVVTFPNYQTLPNPKVYKLSATKSGELLVHCANGGDATIRPQKRFGSIVVSCGK